MENNTELQNLVLEIAKQNILLGQQITTMSQAMSQQNTQLGQRIDSLSQQLGQQNTQLGQRIDTLALRMDNTIQQMQQQHQELVRLSYGVISALEKLPDAVKDQIGFKAK